MNFDIGGASALEAQTIEVGLHSTWRCLPPLLPQPTTRGSIGIFGPRRVERIYRRRYTPSAMVATTIGASADLAHTRHQSQTAYGGSALWPSAERATASRSSAVQTLDRRVSVRWAPRSTAHHGRRYQRPRAPCRTWKPSSGRTPTSAPVDVVGRMERFKRVTVPEECKHCRHVAQHRRINYARAARIIHKS